MLEAILAALVCEGHLLIEGMPGLGKTLSVSVMSKICDLNFKRVQFTPDLLPSDLIGTMIYNQVKEEFSTKFGPIFTQILLADEINRSPAKVQSALLEAMSEEHVTIDGQSHPLPQPFIVLATQNPVEYHGTYPLPEAQLDRFMLQIDLGYPPLDIEQSLAINRSSQDPVDTINNVVTLEDLIKLRASVDNVKIEKSISGYLLQIIIATRHHAHVRLGVSTRGTLLYARIARALAILEGRDYVIPEDIKKLAVPVMSHRILLNTKAQYSGITTPNIIQEILDFERVPR